MNMERLTKDKLYLNSILFGVMCNFSPYCGENMAKEVRDFLTKVFNKLTYFEELSEQEKLLVLPCKIGTQIYHKGLVDCRECPYGKNQTYSFCQYDAYGELFADDCEEECPETVRSIPFSLCHLNDDGSLNEEYSVNKEDVKI